MTEKKNVPAKVKGSFVDRNPAIELLACLIYNEHGEYASSWLELKEKTRDRYRKIARGELPLPTVYQTTEEDD